MDLAEVVLETPRSAWCRGQVFGLGDALEEARVLDKPLSRWRHAQASAVQGATTVRGPALLVGRDLWVSPGMRRGFVRAASRRGGDSPLRLVRPEDGPAATADPLRRLPREAQHILFDLWYLPEGVEVSLDPALGALPEALERAPGLDVEATTHEVSTDVDGGMAGVQSDASLSITIASVAAAPVGHWVELGRANLLAIGTRILGAGPARGLLTLLWAALRAMSLNPFKILQKTTRVGKGCWIHPQAVVEGCVLGDNVKVDACAVLRGCVLGDDVKVGACAVAEYSVLGEGSELQKQATAVLSVVYPGARIGGLLQVGVAGRGVRQKMGSFGTDMNLNGVVRVPSPDGLVPVDIGYQGVCLGHGCFVASGVWIAPGRVIEAGRVLLRPEGSVVLK
jgi:hypothetical protein